MLRKIELAPFGYSRDAPCPRGRGAEHDVDAVGRTPRRGR
jgi:hypothetical protein